jgi:hypothetical protein
MHPGRLSRTDSRFEGEQLKLMGDEANINERMADYLLAQSLTNDNLDRIFEYAASKATIRESISGPTARILSSAR